MADANAAKLPTAVYIEFAGGLPDESGGRPAQQLEARLDASHLPGGQSTLET